MENFLDHRTTKWLGIITQPLEWPIQLTNMDGTANQAGWIERYCDMTIQSGHKRHMIHFYETSLGGDQIIFRYPWLQTFNPEINWEKGMITAPWIKAWVQPKTIVIATAEEIPREYARHAKVFNEEKAKHFPPKREEDHAIKLKSDAPAVLDCKIYQLSPDQDRKLDEFLNEHLQKGYIQESNSPYASPFFFIKKKDGKLWPVQDYRKLNKQTICNTYPLPLIKMILEQLEGKSLFTKFDIQWGYNNIQIKEGDEWKAAFKTPKGLFELRVMFFGLTNSPATFQRTMNCMFQEMKMRYPTKLFMYMDDILIATNNNVTWHWQIIHEVLDKLKEESYFLQLTKCEFEKEKVDYLGVVISKERIHVDPMKVKGLANWPQELWTIKQVWSTLGVLGYQRPFILGFAHITQPLTNLLKKGTTFMWSTIHTKAVNKLIAIVLGDPVLFRPDPKKPFILEVDASAFATGAILYQMHEETRQKHPVCHHHDFRLVKLSREYCLP